MMFKRTLTYIILLFSLTLFTGCFEILEEINLNADGSGSIVVTFNLSKSRSKLASVMLLDSVNGHKIPSKEDITLAIKDATDYLNKAEGISNIKKVVDFDNYIFAISCNFKSIENIDKIFKEEIYKQNRRERTNFSITNFSFNTSKNIFKRHFSYDNSIKKSFNTLKSDDKKAFKEASYTCIYRFKNTIKNVSNKNAKISPNKKAVLLKTAAMSLIQGDKSIENTIQLLNN